MWCKTYFWLIFVSSLLQGKKFLNPGLDLTLSVRFGPNVQSFFTAYIVQFKSIRKNCLHTLIQNSLGYIFITKILIFDDY